MMVQGNVGETPDETSVIEVVPVSTFTLWFHRKQESEESWSNNLMEIASGTAAEITTMLNTFGLPSAPGRTKCDLCIFRSHIVPMWEDPQQERGGRWVLELKKDEIDAAWSRSISELFRSEVSEWTSVTGIYLMLRPRSKIALWFGDSTDASEIARIRKHWGNVIGPDLLKNVVCHTYMQA